MSSSTTPYFPIVGYDAELNTYANIGTAFFINENGYYVTAAHTIRKPGRVFFAVINRVFIPLLKPLLVLDKDLFDQGPPEHHDLCIGKLEVEDSDFYAFKPSAELISEDDLVFKGFSNLAYQDNVNPNRGTRQCVIDDAKAHAAKYGYSEDHELSRIKKSILTGKFDCLNANKITALSKPGLVTNVITFLLTTNIPHKEEIRLNPISNNGFDPSGYSGGPIFHNGAVVAMLITKNIGISSEFIMDKLDEVGVNYYLFNQQPAK
ncbi:serine protease [Pedobacter psychrodurus]|uniref:Serine protease n=1 Tax=Pedobacter psychrodurus TaxID=2530456 RepID=A0A4R0PKH4_9SPHI|nr:serine protease [Pedobacter psychrodurus]TCD18943.1 serine protease [Pedobacter psychrodurus]